MSLTPRGAVILGASIALTVAGLLKIDGVLIALGSAGLVLLTFALIVGKLNLRHLELSLKAPSRVFADTLFDLRLIQKNKRALLDAFGIDIELQLSKAAKIKTHSKWTPSGSTSISKLRGSIARRGAVTDHPCNLSSSFPLGIFRFIAKSGAQQEILVFPKPIVPKEFFASGEFDDAWNGEGFQPGDAFGEPRGLRSMRPGDPAKYLHWPATIRALSSGRDPLVREFDPPGLRPRSVSVIFHSYGTDHTIIRTDLYERALSLLCGTLRHFRGMGVPATLRADFLSWKPITTFQSSAWSEALTLMARATRADDTEAHDLIAEIEAIPRDEAVVVISDMPPEAWRHILPKRVILAIDIQQHNFGKKGMKFGKAKLPPRRSMTAVS